MAAGAREDEERASSRVEALLFLLSAAEMSATVHAVGALHGAVAAS